MTDKDKLEKLKKLADAMYYAAQHLTTDASRLHKAMEEYYQFIINEYHKEEPTIPDIVNEHFYEMLGEEPVSDDLEEAAKTYAKKESHGYEPCNIVETFKAGANWQQQMMMKEAVKGGCFSYRNGYKHISCDIDEKLTDIKFGDKVKLVIIKED